jgi:hypothetical protein
MDRHGSVSFSRKFYLLRWCRQQINLHVGVPNHMNKDVGPFPVIFLGGNALHMALRGRYINCIQQYTIDQDRRDCPTKQFLPLTSHFETITRSLDFLNETRTKFGKQVILIGSVNMDYQTFLPPEKSDCLAASAIHPSLTISTQSKPMIHCPDI